MSSTDNMICIPVVGAFSFSLVVTVPTIIGSKTFPVAKNSTVKRNKYAGNDDDSNIYAALSASRS